jgi:hypothetical protein
MDDQIGPQIGYKVLDAGGVELYDLGNLEEKLLDKEFVSSLSPGHELYIKTIPQSTLEENGSAPNMYYPSVSKDAPLPVKTVYVIAKNRFNDSKFSGHSVDIYELKENGLVSMGAIGLLAGR